MSRRRVLTPPSLLAAPFLAGCAPRGVPDAGAAAAVEPSRP